MLSAVVPALQYRVLGGVLVRERKSFVLRNDRENIASSVSPAATKRSWEASTNDEVGRPLIQHCSLVAVETRHIGEFSLHYQR